MARPILDPLFSKFVKLGGSDLYLTYGFPPSVRVADRIVKLSDTPLNDDDLEAIINEIADEEKREEFYSTMEFTSLISWDNSVRFRINMFRQQQHSGVVVRCIRSEIPTLDELNLPAAYSELIMETRGLVLVVGATGSGKSTSLAAMVGYRNKNGYGHILTIEDPIEFIHHHQGCIITQRDVGIDTYSFGMALKNALRQRPDVVLIGEIRDRDTMEQALYFSETGHLCVATLHAGNTCQAIERIMNFFPEEKQEQVHYNLAYNLKGILSQRLVLTNEGNRRVASEVMLNRGFIRNLIQESKVKDIPDIISKNNAEGMHTFEQSLYKLYADGIISEDIAVNEADNPATMRIMINKDKNSARSSLLGSKPQAF